MKKAVIKDVTDIIDFGQMRGLFYFDIYKFSHSYLEWIIRDTEICFSDLDDFYRFGLPFDFKNNYGLPLDIFNLILEDILKYNAPSQYGSKLVSFDNVRRIKKSNYFLYKDLKVFDFSFSDELKALNQHKLNLL